MWLTKLTDKNGQARIEVFSGLKSMTLDVIGLAGAHSLPASTAARPP
jgi:hypothetical protein